MANELITILGPTATGKTSLAAALAARIGGEVISADSRQVYRGMDIGTGKDLADYRVDGRIIPHHLIDIAEPGEEYNVYRFRRDFLVAYKGIVERGVPVVMCGGTGMYLDAVIRGYAMQEVPHNEALRKRLSAMSEDALKAELMLLKTTHNISDTEDRERMVRAIEIACYQGGEPAGQAYLEGIKHHVFGISLSRAVIRERITARLKKRLEEGMVEEVRGLLQAGLKPEQLEFYGLEYRFLTRFVTGEINYNDMYQQLNSAIHQFAKRQMTWFRRMEKKGVRIKWVDGNMSLDEKLNTIIKCLDS